MFTPNEIQNINTLLSSPKNITVVSHRNPDGDAIGSSLALVGILKKMGHNAMYVSPNSIPDYLCWLTENKDIIIAEEQQEKATNAFKNSDIIFTLDFNALHRTGEITQAILENISSTFIMIDHHQMPDAYAKYTFSDVNYGSTCEMIYDFITKIDQKENIDKEIATCIYTGIVTDSGSFKFPKTTAKTHRCVAYLIEQGIENTNIHSTLFDNGNYDRLQLLGRALQNMVLLPEYNASYITLSQEELNLFKYKKGDTEGIVNYGLNIKGIEKTAIFIENAEDKMIKISFRSKGDVDVNTFSRNHFEGGGHKNAAGGKSFLSLKDTVNKFITILAQENSTNEI